MDPKNLTLSTLKRLSLTLLLSSFAFATTYAQSDENGGEEEQTSLIINTGYDHGTNSTIAFEQQDPWWVVTKMTTGTMLTPYTSFPYNAFASDWWTLSSYNTAGAPLAGSQWITYGPNTMNVPGGETDYQGTTITFERNFQLNLPAGDAIIIDADIKADNYISDIRVDGVSTGFSIIGGSGWLNPAHLSYQVSMTQGIHNIEVDVVNIGTGQTVNPSGFCLVGTIKSVSGTGTIANKMSPTSIRDHSSREGYSLGMPVPNPCTNKATITYNIPDSKKQTYVSLYNITGIEVAHYNINTTGKGSITVDAASMPKGLYIYTLFVDGKQIDTQKLLISK